MHRIDRGARIHRSNRSVLSVSAAGVALVAIVVPDSFVLRDRQKAGSCCLTGRKQVRAA
jgi:hypothetical protein